MRDRNLWILAALSMISMISTLVADLATKHWVWTQLRPSGDSVCVLGSTLELSFAFNRGTAFSVIRDVQYPLVFLPITLVVVALTAFIALRSPGVDRLRMVALGLVSGGALGNLHDRLFRVDALGDHGVVDFIVVNYPWGGSWPSFNLADTALVVGTMLLMVSLSRGSDATQASTTAQTSAAS
jgi:signal peptidase II